MNSTSVESRTPRKRATRRRVSAERVIVPDNYKEETSQAGAEKEKNVPDNVVQARRKAPTSLGVAAKSRQENKKQLTVVVIVLLLGVGSSAMVGLSDAGQIDVRQTIEARNERIRNNQADERDLLTSMVEVPVQNTNPDRKADGGLVGLGTGGAPPKPVLPPATDTASTSSSTSQTASSTEVVASSTDEALDEEERFDEDLLSEESSAIDG